MNFHLAAAALVSFRCFVAGVVKYFGMRSSSRIWKQTRCHGYKYSSVLSELNYVFSDLWSPPHNPRLFAHAFTPTIVLRVIYELSWTCFVLNELTPSLTCIAFCRNICLDDTATATATACRCRCFCCVCSRLQTRSCNTGPAYIVMTSHLPPFPQTGNSRRIGADRHVTRERHRRIAGEREGGEGRETDGRTDVASMLMTRIILHQVAAE